SSSSIHLPEEAMRNCESRAGTCLIATTIFITILLYRQAVHRGDAETRSKTRRKHLMAILLRSPRVPPRLRGEFHILTRRLFLISLENETTVGTAETETVRQRIVDLHRPR